MSPARQAGLLFACQLTGHALITVNFRAIAHDKIALALSTDALHASLAFFVIRHVARSKEAVGPWLGYLGGSLAGTAIGMWLS